MAQSQRALRKCLRRLKDPRINRCKRHLLLDIILMALCAVIAGADTWIDLATFARRGRQARRRELLVIQSALFHENARSLGGNSRQIA